MTPRPIVMSTSVAMPVSTLKASSPVRSMSCASSGRRELLVRAWRLDEIARTARVRRKLVRERLQDVPHLVFRTCEIGVANGVMCRRVHLDGARWPFNSDAGLERCHDLGLLHRSGFLYGLRPQHDAFVSGGIELAQVSQASSVLGLHTFDKRVSIRRVEVVIE